MLSQAGIKDSNTQLQINVILSAWQLVVAFIGSLSAEKIGRKVLCLVSLGFATIFFFMVGGLTAAFGESANKSGVYGTVASIFLFLGAYSFGLTPLTVMYGPEVLSYSLRATGMSLTTVASKSCGLLVVSNPINQHPINKMDALANKLRLLRFPMGSKILAGKCT